VPPDDRRQWYRYHHLFADVLRAHLLDEQADELAELHLRASSWFEANEDASQAVTHALEGSDFDPRHDLIADGRRNRRPSVALGPCASTVLTLGAMEHPPFYDEYRNMKSVPGLRPPSGSCGGSTACSSTKSFRCTRSGR